VKRAPRATSRRRQRRLGGKEPRIRFDPIFHFGKTKSRARLFYRLSPFPTCRRGRAGALRRRSAQKFGAKRTFPFSSCKPLISHKTAKGIFGNIWRKRPQIWKCLAPIGKSLPGAKSGKGASALSPAPPHPRAARAVRTQAASQAGKNNSPSLPRPAGAPPAPAGAGELTRRANPLTGTRVPGRWSGRSPPASAPSAAARWHVRFSMG
jgi:hypothetical protein